MTGKCYLKTGCYLISTKFILLDPLGENIFLNKSSTYGVQFYIIFFFDFLTWSEYEKFVACFINYYLFCYISECGLIPKVIIYFTEGELHVKHKIKEDSKCPHVHFVTICLIQINFRRHIMFCSKNSTSNILVFLRKSKIGQFEHLILNNFLHICLLGLFSWEEYFAVWYPYADSLYNAATKVR